MKTRFLAIFADAPVLFFAVVIGVALTFRISIGAVREAMRPPEIAPTFVSGPEPGLPAAGADANVKTASALPQAEVGAAGTVQPLGTPPAATQRPAQRPAPARIAPKPRGHGRPSLRGGTER